MSRPACPGSNQPATRRFRVIMTRLGNKQRVGLCAACNQLVMLQKGGVVIEHLVDEQREVA